MCHVFTVRFSKKAAESLRKTEVQKRSKATMNRVMMYVCYCNFIDIN